VLNLEERVKEIEKGDAVLREREKRLTWETALLVLWTLVNAAVTALNALIGYWLLTR
jgi:hypothetical protein